MKQKILAIGTHPDDIEIGCGGTLSILNKRGYETTHVVVTSGEEGSLETPKSQTIRRRESEAKKSAKILNSSQVFFLREPDGLTTFSKETKIKLISLIRKVQPDIVFTHAKSDHFPDHQVVYQLTKSALLAAAGPWYPDAGKSPHQVKEFYGYEVWNPISEYQVAFDVSIAMKQKVEALKAHLSQTSAVDYVGAIQGLAQYRGAMTLTGKYAEVFELYRTESFR